MKRNKYLIMAALATAVGLASCSDDDGCGAGTPQDNIVRVSARVNDADKAATRSCTTDNLTEFGISITNPNFSTSDDPTYTYDNVQVTGSSAAGWTTATQMLWQHSSQAVSIVAYAPYSSEAAGIATSTAYGVAVEADQSTEDGLNKSDLLTFKNSSFTPSTDLNDGAVDISFTHALSQLMLTVTLGTEFNEPSIPTANPISDLKVNGTIASTTCDFTQTTPTLAAVSGEAAATSVTASQSGYTAAASETVSGTATYECILIPQTVAAGGFSVSFTIDGKFYEWTSASAVTLAGGTSYTLALTVGDDIVTAKTINTSKWTENTGSLETK